MKAGSAVVWSPLTNKLNTPSQQSSKIFRKWSDRLAPQLPGLCSLQAVGSGGSPDVTAYRNSSGAAARWMQILVGRGGFDHYLLRFSACGWDVYDGDGKFEVKHRSHPPENQPRQRELDEVVDVDRGALLAEARATLFDDGLSLLACAEGHAGASAADHSNYVLVLRRLIMEAGPDDLPHFYVVDSRAHRCRASGIYARVDKLSRAVQDAYLDRYKWLANSWPLVPDSHVDMLADRIAKTRMNFMMDLIAQCGRNMPHESVTSAQAKWAIAPLGARYRFARHVVSTLKEGLLFAPGAAEVFDSAVVEARGALALKGFQTLLR